MKVLEGTTKAVRAITKGHYTIRRHPDDTSYKHPTWKLYDDNTDELVVTCSYLKGAIATAEKLLTLENAIRIPLNVPAYLAPVFEAFYDALVGRAEFSPSLDRWHLFHAGFDADDGKLILCARGERSDGGYKNPYTKEAAEVRTWLAKQLKATAMLELKRSDWKAGNQYALDTFGGKATVAEVFSVCECLEA